MKRTMLEIMVCLGLLAFSGFAIGQQPDEAELAHYMLDFETYGNRMSVIEDAAIPLREDVRNNETAREHLNIPLKSCYPKDNTTLHYLDTSGSFFMSLTEWIGRIETKGVASDSYWQYANNHYPQIGFEARTTFGCEFPARSYFRIRWKVYGVRNPELITLETKLYHCLSITPCILDSL